MRILYLVNHSTIIEFEPQFLVDLGFEVFVVKQKDIPFAYSTIGETYDYDYTLSFSKNDLEILNNFSFLDSFHLLCEPTEIIKLINKHFDIVITLNGFDFNFLFYKHFKGLIFARGFGLVGNLSYEKLLSLNPIYNQCKLKPHDEILYWLLSKFEFLRPKNIDCLNKCTYLISKHNKRILFLPSYDNLTANEPGVFKNNAKYIPISVSPDISAQRNTWRGSENKIMFVLRMVNNQYYIDRYNKFKQYFSDLPHTIFGRDSDYEIDDSNIAGYVEPQAFIKCFQNYKLLFYDPVETRHIYYHPIEAIFIGMPVIFMAGGMLELLGGVDQPGAAHSYEEAREKILRIMNNDETFINEILNCQTKIIKTFQKSFVTEKWREEFLPVANRIKRKKIKHKNIWSKE